MQIEAPDAEYLKATVGDALAKGIAAVAVAQPVDPVAFLGDWLIKNVKDKEIEAEHERVKLKLLQIQHDKAEAEVAAALRKQQEEAAREAELQALQAVPHDVWKLWQQAIDVCLKHTSAGAAYVATVSQQLGPLPEVPEGNDLPSVPPHANPEEERSKEREENGDKEEGPDEDGEAVAEEGEAHTAKLGGPRKFLQYVAASAGQEWLVDQKIVLQAPEAIKPQGEEEQDPPEPKGEEDTAVVTKHLPLSLQLLERGAASVYIPNVAFEPEIRFFRNFPRVGAYFGAAAEACGSPLAVVAVDTLAPLGSGLPLPEQDREFVARVAQSVGVALAKVAEQREAAANGFASKEVLQLEAALRGLAPWPQVEPQSPPPVAAPSSITPPNGISAAASQPPTEVHPVPSEAPGGGFVGKASETSDPGAAAVPQEAALALPEQATSDSAAPDAGTLSGLDPNASEPLGDQEPCSLSDPAAPVEAPLDGPTDTTKVPSFSGATPETLPDQTGPPSMLEALGEAGPPSGLVPSNQTALDEEGSNNAVLEAARQLPVGDALLEGLQKACSSEKEARAGMGHVQGLLRRNVGLGVRELRLAVDYPPATYRSLCAVLLAVGVADADLAPWGSCRAHVNMSTLEKVLEWDPALPKDANQWKKIRANIAGAAASRPALLQEAPLSCFGYILLLLGEQWVKVAQTAETVRQAGLAIQTRVAKLKEAEEARAQEEAAARLAAEEAAAQEEDKHDADEDNDEA
eukprot:jgi/Botrbrau1/19053/Bobra.0100s0077.1